MWGRIGRSKPCGEKHSRKREHKVQRALRWEPDWSQLGTTNLMFKEEFEAREKKLVIIRLQMIFKTLKLYQESKYSKRRSKTESWKYLNAMSSEPGRKMGVAIEVQKHNKNAVSWEPSEESVSRRKELSTSADGLI